MNLATVLAIVVLAGVIFLAARYVVREKKRGVKCIGCPYADSCQKHGGANAPAPHCGK